MIARTTPNAPVILGWMIWLLTELMEAGGWYHHESLDALAIISALIFIVMMMMVFRVVHYAEELAHRMGEPYGTLVLTLSATIIEAALLIMVMNSGTHNPTLLRDTVFATLMLVLNGMVGFSLVTGGIHYLEQTFKLQGALAFLQMITPLAILILILPNYTTSLPGPYLSDSQSFFIGFLCLVVYAVFLVLQTGRYRVHFVEMVSSGEQDRLKHEPDHKKQLTRAFLGLISALLPIVLLSEHLAESINYGIEELKLPAHLGGILVNMLVLAPEFMAASRAALQNRIQRAVNISLGSALATISLTVPLVLVYSALIDHPIVIGLTGSEIPLIYATIFVALITFVSGKATLLQGVVHLMLFATYLFLIFAP
jgi:Ca2+:H+ antiporter